MLAPAALGTAVDALFRTDQDLKRSAGDARILLERLVVELCGGRARRGQGARPLHT
jgi:DNA polymerase III delta subunit